MSVSVLFKLIPTIIKIPNYIKTKNIERKKNKIVKLIKTITIDNKGFCISEILAKSKIKLEIIELAINELINKGILKEIYFDGSTRKTKCYRIINDWGD